MRLWNLIVEFSLEGANGERVGQGFHIGSGYAYAGRIDHALLKMADGLPYLPGSALKGKFRHAAREVAYALDIQICKRECLPENPCAHCRMFGSRFLRGGLTFSDARCEVRENPVLGIVSDGAARMWEERSGVAIDRRTRVAFPRHLFQTEAAPEGLIFKGTIESPFEDDAVETSLLRAAVRSIAFFGGDSSRGLGACRCRLE